MPERAGISSRYFTKIEQLEQLTEQEAADLGKVAERFSFRSNGYYLSLIDWADPNDPIRTIVVPHMQELDEWGRLDPSDEKTYTVMPGVEHKYHSTALLLVSSVCEGICRYCFRKRVFIEPQSTCLRDIPAAMRYIREHREVTNVLLTGGDPLVLTTSKLEEIIRQLREIEHVEIVRIGTKVPAFNPYRILDDPGLLEMIETYSTEQKKIYVMTHFVHPKELTDVAVKAVHLLQKAGAVTANQSPLIRNLNDDPEVMAELLAKLSFAGIVPYYIFQCRPALGNKAYTVPIEEGYEIVERAKARVSGLAKRARYTMSHSTGKIEIIGKTKRFVHLKYHRAADDADSGRFLVFRCNPNAYWFDDYEEVARRYPIEMPYRSYGPQ
ncbi:MAG: KamA family radical SAM protein [Phycisphaerales bacterium]|nr:MAG: KamA family radical SAM protein [Phycisphaerales bacterium]